MFTPGTADVNTRYSRRSHPVQPTLTTVQQTFTQGTADIHTDTADVHIRYSRRSHRYSRRSHKVQPTFTQGTADVHTDTADVHTRFSRHSHWYSRCSHPVQPTFTPSTADVHTRYSKHSHTVQPTFTPPPPPPSPLPLPLPPPPTCRWCPPCWRVCSAVSWPRCCSCPASRPLSPLSPPPSPRCLFCSAWRSSATPLTRCRCSACSWPLTSAPPPPSRCRSRRRMCWGYLAGDGRRPPRRRPSPPSLPALCTAVHRCGLLRSAATRCCSVCAALPPGAPPSLALLCRGATSSLTFASRWRPSERTTAVTTTTTWAARRLRLHPLVPSQPRLYTWHHAVYTPTGCSVHTNRVQCTHQQGTVYTPTGYSAHTNRVHWCTHGTTFCAFTAKLFTIMVFLPYFHNSFFTICICNCIFVNVDFVWNDHNNHDVVMRNV